MPKHKMNPLNNRVARGLGNVVNARLRCLSGVILGTTRLSLPWGLLAEPFSPLVPVHHQKGVHMPGQVALVPRPGTARRAARIEATGSRKGKTYEQWEIQLPNDAWIPLGMLLPEINDRGLVVEAYVPPSAMALRYASSETA